ncbi:MAG TPA: hypothetical protein EYQ50_01495 [Verrucomicrobiales bacterium]|nr:hypothetical protein [Verrucomicrobiales bacterium]HIL70982.1 hypothetical protein [Verrucomicrobiota bacterium]
MDSITGNLHFKNSVKCFFGNLCPILFIAIGVLIPGWVIEAESKNIPPEVEANDAGPVKETSFFEDTLALTKLYNNPNNTFVQSVTFTGRYQMDYTVLDSDDYDRLNNRRWRMGFKVKLFKDFSLHSEVSLDHDENPVYTGLTDQYLAWSPKENLTFTLGKHSTPFTLDGHTSSKRLLTIDRSNLSNNMWFTREYQPGVSGKGFINQWVWQVGVYSSGSVSKEFGNFDGKGFILSTVGYDFAKALNVEKALLRLNYVYQEEDEDNTATRNLRNVASLNFSYDRGKWGFRSDLTGATGYEEQSDLWGVTVMPFYNISDKFQPVLRYTYLSSNDPNGVRLARYENQVISGRGDEYNEIFGGLNYYIYGHNLKIQSGIKYAEMHDAAHDGGSYRGWGWTTGLRLSW